MGASKRKYVPGGCREKGVAVDYGYARVKTVVLNIYIRMPRTAEMA